MDYDFIYDNMTLLLKGCSETRSYYVKNADYLDKLADHLIEIGITCDNLNTHAILQAFDLIPKEEWEKIKEVYKGDNYTILAEEDNGDVLILGD